MKIYHKSIGFPSSLILPTNFTFNLVYSNHALKKIFLQYFIYGATIVPITIIVKKKNIIEVHTTKKSKIKKIVIRTSYDKKKDIIFVLELKYHSSEAKVITLWLNNKKDKHYTLDKTKYDKP